MHGPHEPAFARTACECVRADGERAEDVDHDDRAARLLRTRDACGVDDVQFDPVSDSIPGDGPRAFGFEQIADCGSMRVVGLRLEPGQTVPEHRNAIPVALIVTSGRLQFDDGTQTGEVAAGEMLLINPGERHRYHAEVATSAYLVFAGLPGVRSRTWTLRRRA